MVLNKYPFLLLIRSDDFLKNSDIIMLNKSSADAYTSIEVKLAFKIMSNHCKHMNFLILAFQFELDL